MSEPFLYLEDLVKAEVPKPPKSIGGGPKPPGARSTLAGGPKATPPASDKAQALAGGPLKRIEAPAPSGAQTLSQKNPNPPVSPAAKQASTIKYEWWSGTGTPPADGGWEKGPEGGWRRPEGSGKGGGKGESENLISDMAPDAKPEDPTTAQKQDQAPDKKLVTSGDKESAPVSSSAEKIEESKQATAPPPVSEEAQKVVKQKADNAKLHAESEKKIRAEAEKQLKEEAKSAAGEGEKPKKPNQEQIKKMAQKLSMEADNHRQSARNMLENVQAHAERETDPERKEQLEKIAGYLEEQSNIKGDIGNQDKDILKMAQQAVKHHGANKPPKDEEPKEQVSNKPKYNYGAAFDSGRALGEQVGGAAATLEGGGAFVPTVVNYGGKGAVQGGHHLLRGDGKKAASEAAPKKAPTKGAEVEQSSMKTEKSLPLYLDLDILKAVSSPNIGNTTPSESRARIKHESSYAKRPVGVANEGIVTEDDPDEGKDWKHDDANAVETSVDQKLKEKETDEEETEEETEKALLADPSSLLKSLNTEVRTELNRVLPSANETSFMVNVLHYDPTLVAKGQKHIMGKDRHLFNEWMQGRLSKSISSLTERIVIK